MKSYIRCFLHTVDSKGFYIAKNPLRYSIENEGLIVLTSMEDHKGADNKLWTQGFTGYFSSAPVAVMGNEKRSVVILPRNIIGVDENLRKNEVYEWGEELNSRRVSVTMGDMYHLGLLLGVIDRDKEFATGIVDLLSRNDIRFSEKIKITNIIKSWLKSRGR